MYEINHGLKVLVIIGWVFDRKFVAFGDRVQLWKTVVKPRLFNKTDKL